ncbi:hypothetical protein Plhal304r1_c004g0014371 [Plasmopara halstedii]
MMQNISHLVVRLSKHDTEVLHGGVYKRKLHTVNVQCTLRKISRLYRPLLV